MASRDPRRVDAPKIYPKGTPHPGTTKAVSRRMSRIPQSGTAPELVVRRISQALGQEMKYNVVQLPGKPDLANLSEKIAIFVHGCFWHGHAGCRKSAVSGKNAWWWRQKIQLNRARDRRKDAELRKIGYRVVTIWECQVTNENQLTRTLRAVFRRVTKSAT